MPDYLSPGVYVEEVSGGTRPIGAVGTSIAALFGSAPKVDAAPRIPTLVTSIDEFQRQFISDEQDPEPSIATAVAVFPQWRPKALCRQSWDY